MSDEPSIFSHEERAIAAELRAETDPVTIAEKRDTSIGEVEAAVERIREKTERAFVTLDESPFTNDLAAGLDSGRRETLRAAFDE